MITRVWRFLRPPVVAFSGMLLATVPLVFRPSPDWVWLMAFFDSPVLVWSGFFFTIEILRPRAQVREKIMKSFLLYFSVGVAWVASVSLGAWPVFSLGKLSMTYLVFALAWPHPFMWILFASLSWFPLS